MLSEKHPSPLDTQPKDEIRRLRKTYKSGLHTDIDEPSTHAQMELARLGGEKELAEVACEVRYGSNMQRYNAIYYKLPYIKGDFSLNLIKKILESKDYSPEYSILTSDMMPLGRTRLVAIKVLSEMIPELSAAKYGHFPDAIAGKPEEQLAEEWLSWIKGSQAGGYSDSPSPKNLDESMNFCNQYLRHENKKLQREKIKEIL